MRCKKLMVSIMMSALTVAGCDLFKGSQKVSLPDQPIVNAASAGPKAAGVQSDREPQSNASAAEVDTATPSENQPAEGTTLQQPAKQKGGAQQASRQPDSAPAQAAASDGGIKNRFSGTVATRNKASMAFKVSGFIEKILVQTGQNFKRGSVLAKLDPRDYKINRDMAQAQLDLAKVALTNATREYDREKSLYQQKASTDSSFDRLTAGLDKAKLDVQMADLRLQQTTQSLDDTTLRAPYDCVVTKQIKNEHENVGVGTPVLEIYNIADLEFQFSVPENLAGKIKVGDKMEVKIPATGFNAKLEVTRLVPVIADANRTFQIVVRAPTDDTRVVGGLYAEAVMP